MIVPTNKLLPDADAARIRCARLARHGAGLALAAFVMLVAVPARAGWVGDAADMMGTRVSVELWADDEARGRELAALVMGEYRRIDDAMSTYKPDSEISRVNAHAAQAPMPISDELFGLVERSLGLSKASGGAFDITYDSVGYLYDFRAHQRPTDAEIAEHLAAIDYRHVVLDRERRTIFFKTKGVRINLGGIAKGYVVERAAAMLRERGVEHALLNAGGDTRVLGDRRGQPWIVGIRHPRDDGQVVTRLPLVDEAISTAGDYERYFEENGRRYHHILNPATGRPTEGILTVTVIGPDGTLTDGLDTAIFVLGAEKGLTLIEAYPEYETIIVDAAGKIWYSKGLVPPSDAAP
jgi:thiamine biosynthesis lipoprotein